MGWNMILRKDQGRLLAEFQYNPVWIAKIKSIPGTRWLTSHKAWAVPQDKESVQMFRRMFPWAQISQEITNWENQMLTAEKINQEIKSKDVSELDWHDGVFNGPPLYPHQRKALDLMWRNKNFALAMEMGTGKTRAMIELIAYIKRKNLFCPWIVVCPLSVVGVWAEQVNAYAPYLKVIKLVGHSYDREKLLLEEADIFVINYEGLRLIEYHLSKRKWGGIVCDESHRIKNRSSLQSKCCYKLGEISERRYALTGTMITNNPLDAFGQFKFINEAILGSNFFAFQNRYAIMVTSGKARFPVKFINLQDLADRISPWTFRITKEQAKLGLPDKIYETRYVDLPENAKKIYKQLGKELLAEIGDKVITAQIVLTKILRFSQITAGFVKTEDGAEEELHERKIQELLDILEQTEGQCVVWTKFKREMEMVKRALDKHGIGSDCLSGDTPQADREEILKRFANHELRVFIGQVQAGGTGISLTAASTCVYMSSPFSLGDRLQSEDRLHRIGQKNPVTYIDLICPGTIDETVIRILKNKKSMADIITGDKPNLQLIEEIIGGHRE